MPTVVFSDGGHDGGGLARFDDGHDLVGLRTPEVPLRFMPARPDFYITGISRA
jgi:hypothetical protein